jgi:two-component system sensor histidine kinase PilS (NtrC family)
MKISKSFPYRQEVKMEDQDKKRLRLLIIYRALVITIFLGIAIFLDVKRQETSVHQSYAIYYYYIIICLMYVISISYVFLLKYVEDLFYNIYLQISVDILLVTTLVYFTGSAHSNYSLLYPLIIIYAVIFVGRKGGLIVASASAILYAFLLTSEYFQIIPSTALEAPDYRLTIEEIFIRILLHIISFFTVALLASFVVEQERKTRHLLEEKETEFIKLDLLFRSIIESVDTGVMTLDLQDKIKTFNRAAEEITGYKLRQIENRYIADVFPEIAPILRNNGKSEYSKNRREAIINSSRGSEIHLGCSVSPLRDNKEKQIGNIIIFQDITEKRKMEENLEKSKRLALIGEMAAGLAHEMRNPLASITGSIELLKQGLNLEDTDKRLMQIIVRGKNQLDNFVRDFLLLARPMPATKEVVNINEVIEEVLESLKLSNDWPEYIEVKKKFSNETETFANRQQIRQIFNNLILNAVQSMKQKGILFMETSVVKHDDEIDYAQIIIKDTGCGIEPEHLKKIFEPFYTNKEKGTGLGLTIVGRIIDAYKGKIRIDSTVDAGTSCFVWLPVNPEGIPPLVA